jgi:hypothetical protein
MREGRRGGEVSDSVHRQVFQDRPVKTFCDVRLVAPLQVWRELQRRWRFLGCHARDLCARTTNTEHQHHECRDTPNIFTSQHTTIEHTVQKSQQTITTLHATTINSPKCFSTKIPLLYVHPLSPHKTTRMLTSAQLISQCTSHFKIGNDTASLLRISDSLSTLSSFRTQHLQTLQSSLSQLSRTHHTLSANHTHTISQHNAVDHASEILRLDTEKFKIAKQASDLEIEGERLASDLSRLGNVAGELEEEGVEGGVVERPGDDATV